MSSTVVIFDCDGVLVDSEVIGARVLSEMALDVGLRLSVEDALAFLRGRRVSVWVEELAERCGRPLGEPFVERYRQQSARSFKDALRPIPNVEAAIRTLNVPFCVASSSPRSKIELVLGLTGLLRHFEGRIFSAYEIGSWKPDPGLFLAAAAAMDAEPKRCIVVEDSLVGVQAGIAAGMLVLGYAPHDTAVLLADAGAEVFASMSELPSLLESHGA